MSYLGSGSSLKFGSKHYQPYVHDGMQYNRAELMRMQEQGIEIIIGPKPQNQPKPPSPLNPPTVTIKNLNIVADQNRIDSNDNDDNNKEEPPINSNIGSTKDRWCYNIL